MKKTLGVLGSVLALSACGGGGGGGTGAGPGVGPVSQFNSGDANLDTLLVSVDSTSARFDEIDFDDGFSPVSAAQAETGSVIYNGFSTYVEETLTLSPSGSTVDYIAVGSFTAVADFSNAQSVTGTADGFFEVIDPSQDDLDDLTSGDLRTSGPIAGSVAFDLSIGEGSSMNAIANGLANGSLTKADGTVVVIDDRNMRGNFSGDNLEAFEAVGGTFSGDTVTDLTVTGLR